MAVRKCRTRAARCQQRPVEPDKLFRLFSSRADGAAIPREARLALPSSWPRARRPPASPTSCRLTTAEDAVSECLMLEVRSCECYRQCKMVMCGRLNNDTGECALRDELPYHGCWHWPGRPAELQLSDVPDEADSEVVYFRSARWACGWGPARLAGVAAAPLPPAAGLGGARSAAQPHPRLQPSLRPPALPGTSDMPPPPPPPPLPPAAQTGTTTCSSRGLGRPTSRARRSISSTPAWRPTTCRWTSAGTRAASTASA
jgi:hypothetical protein